MTQGLLRNLNSLEPQLPQHKPQQALGQLAAFSCSEKQFVVGQGLAFSCSDEQSQP